MFLLCIFDKGLLTNGQPLNPKIMKVRFTNHTQPTDHPTIASIHLKTTSKITCEHCGDNTVDNTEVIELIMKTNKPVIISCYCGRTTMGIEKRL